MIYEVLFRHNPHVLNEQRSLLTTDEASVLARAIHAFILLSLIGPIYWVEYFVHLYDQPDNITETLQ